ncbi:MAG TPA: TadE/TadG family type IV pilus assembly protein [Actinomycetota bacterium]|nr:TadE/TadG family type IV pilus assembly protein [Actinomycetota bacterium]
MPKTRIESGQSTVELALLLPVLVLLLAGLVEIGLVVADQGRLWHAAREAVRVAVVDPDSADVKAAAERGGLSPIEVTVDPPAHLRRQGDALTVALVHRPRARLPLFGTLLERVELRAEGTMRIEQP